MRVGEICETNISFCSPQTSVVEAAKQMQSHHVGDLVVVVDEPGGLRPVGILTDRDIALDVVAQERPLAGLTVADIMSRSLVCVDVHKHVYDALALMRHKGVRRVPVVNDDDKLIGIVSLDDIVQHIAEEMGFAAKLLAEEREHEATSRPKLVKLRDDKKSS